MTKQQEQSRRPATSHESNGAGPTPAEVVAEFRLAISSGQPWQRALLEAVGRWPLAEEEIDGVRYQYLLLGQAFDWVKLAGRILEEVDGLVSSDEKLDLLFHNRLPADLGEAEFKTLIGAERHSGHLNYFYGVMAEESLLLAVEESIRKEWTSMGLPDPDEITALAYQRIYGESQEALLREFCQELGRPMADLMPLVQLKEFTYWLFKRRVANADSSRVASDTRKGLERLFRLYGS